MPDSTVQAEWFQPLGQRAESEGSPGREEVGHWREAWRRLRENKLAMAGLVIISITILLALLGPVMVHYPPDAQDLSNTYQWPNAQHWFGTDKFGRDLWVRVWEGARISLIIGFSAALLDLLVGILYGGIAAYYGGVVDNIMMRFIEIMIGIPSLILNVLMIVYMNDSGVFTIVVALVITGWVNMARLVRGQVLQLRNQEFVLAARSLGASSWRLITRHLIPNTVGIIIVQLTFTIPSAIFNEAILSFLGLGVRVPEASLGSLCFDGLETLQLFPYQLFFPALVISLIMFSFNMLGDGLRDALDPKMRK
jgi:oligopeptide transport system permease protein